MSKQHSTLLPKAATMSNDFHAKFRPFNKVKSCFDIVAVFRQQYCRFRPQCCRFWQPSRTKFRPFDKFETNWTCSVFPTLSKGRNFVRHCCRNRQHCCQKRQQNVETTFDLVERIVRLVHSTMLLRHCCCCGPGFRTSTSDARLQRIRNAAARWRHLSTPESSDRQSTAVKRTSITGAAAVPPFADELIVENDLEPDLQNFFYDKLRKNLG